MTGEGETSTLTAESETPPTEVVVDTATTVAPPPVDNAHVAPGCEQFADPRAVKNPGLPKPGKPVMIRRAGKPDAPGLIASVDGSGLVTATVIAANHHLVDTVKNLAEIHPADRLTGWYWPED